MTSSLQKRTLLILLAILVCHLNSFGQKIVESRQSSYLTYIYKITNEEARKIYGKKYWEADASFFHTVVDSFPTDRRYDRELPQGHYLKTCAKENKQELQITTIQNFDVFIFNNNTDLCIQVYDLKGNPIDKATVTVRRKKLRFNKSTQSFLDKKSNQKGLLEVTYNGFTCYYHLSRDHNNSFIKRGTRKVLVKTPLKYIWLPVKYVAFLPIDGIKSIVRRGTYGTIRRTRRFFIRTYERVACLFDDYYCNNYSRNRFERKHTGYMVFSKPKYLPGDTVKLKAFLVNKKGKPVNKKVALVLQNNRKNIEIAKLNPYRKGAYSHEFYLHDSLQLKLDKNYRVQLQLSKNKEYINGFFRYEDYELSKNNLELRVEEETQYRNKNVSLYVKGKDENDLTLLDARIEVIVTPRSLDNHFEQQFFLPDTLLYLEKKLHPTEETEVVISSANFPKANFNYAANVRLLTSDNEVISKKEQLFYAYNSKKFDINLEADSIRIEYLKNGQKESKQIIVKTSDNFENQTEIYKGTTPCAIELNPFYSFYRIYTDDGDKVQEAIRIASEPPLIQCLSKRTKDSIYVEVRNPRKIPFQYNIYKKDRQQALGFADSLTIEKKSNSKQTYYVSLRYLWGGEVAEETFRIPLIDKKLNISVTQPKIVYPGQKSQIELTVTDTEGKPVEDVDITAFSLTKKFGYKAPELPYLGKSRKNRKVINNFYFDNYPWKNKKETPLDYNTWKALAGLDSIEYYQFIYPENGFYRFDYPAQDSITQFAPFVVSNGARMPIHVIYVDNKPVYFSWSTNKQPYSFRIKPGYHQIKLRTSWRETTIDSVYFESGKKLILSMDENSKHDKLNIRTVGIDLSTQEKRLLYKYILPYNSNFGEHFAYIKQGDNIQILSQSESYNTQNFAGPLTGDLTFQLLDSFSTSFYHEPFFEYWFSQSRLKMREKKVERYPEELLGYTSSYSLTDEVLTEETIVQQWGRHLDSKRYRTPRYQNPTTTSQGAGRLQFKLKKKDVETTRNRRLNVLVFKSDDHEFLRVYPGNTSTIHDLQKGHYKLIFFYPGEKYHVEDSIAILPNGLNYYEFERPDSLQKDSFSIQVSDLIEKTIFKSNFSTYDKEKELEQINSKHQQQFNYLGIGEVIEGYLYDEENNEPLPFATVVVKGTTFGTTTDLDGYYSINVPPGKKTLIFSYIGFETVEYDIGYSGILNVNLSQGEELQLDEIVVVAYKVPLIEHDMTASGVTVSYNDISRMPVKDVASIISKTAGVSISPNNPFQISIRGTNTTTFDQRPLFIINGNVFLGDISELDPAIIERMEVLEGEKAMAVYGSAASNGVVLIQTKPGTFKPTQRAIMTDQDELFLEPSSENNSIRDNFSDYAFWQPRLTTNKEGKVNFEVEFPDDVTSWETHYMAMNDSRQSGQTKDLIKSYKPLMAQLALPRFLIQSDTTYAIGKSLNYRPDSVEITTKFEVNGKEEFSHSTYCKNALIDTLSVIANDDSLDIKYYLETKQDYFDGEKRNIPVYPKGIEVATGHFYALTKDTSIQLQFNDGLGKVQLYAKSDLLDVVKDEIQHVVNYRYYCNEQIASKLKALIAAKNISTFLGEKFKQNNAIEKLIRRLQKNQKRNGMWAWWKDSDESVWISLHVLEALIQAGKSGFRNVISRDKITELLLMKFETTKDTKDKMRMLKILALFEANIDYPHYISNVKRSMGNSLNEHLKIMELQMLCNIDNNLDTLASFKKTTMLGNTYYSDVNKANNILNNDVQNTILAYKLLKADSTLEGTIFTSLRNYFLENRANGYWRNTYESAQIIETLLPDLLKTNPTLSKPTLFLKGTINKTISEYPFELEVNPDEKIEISKSGDYPIYFTSYQRYWNNQPDKKTTNFEISTRFNNTSSNTLIGGKETKLVTTVVVKKASEYVMLNIPIPGGCSYANKNNAFPKEAHREYFKHETAIFCDYLPEGEHTFEIDLIPRYTGVYTVNPAKVELMYFPTVNGNNELKMVKVR